MTEMPEEFRTATVTFEEFVERDGLLRGTVNYYKLIFGWGEVDIPEADE